MKKKFLALIFIFSFTNTIIGQFSVTNTLQQNIYVSVAYFAPQTENVDDTKIWFTSGWVKISKKQTIEIVSKVFNRYFYVTALDEYGSIIFGEQEESDNQIRFLVKSYYLTNTGGVFRADDLWKLHDSEKNGVQYMIGFFKQVDVGEYENFVFSIK